MIQVAIPAAQKSHAISNEIAMALRNRSGTCSHISLAYAADLPIQPHISTATERRDSADRGNVPTCRDPLNLT